MATELIHERQIERKYEVDADIVSLTITIGEAQIGVSGVLLDDHIVAKGAVSGLPLGSGTILKNRTLAIRTVVTDVNPSTNRTAATYQLVGGPREFDVTLAVDAAGNNQSVIYQAFITFV